MEHVQQRWKTAAKDWREEARVAEVGGSQKQPLVISFRTRLEGCRTRLFKVSRAFTHFFSPLPTRRKGITDRVD
jgi:hypothetical protein